MKKERWYKKISNWLIIIASIILIPILIMNLTIMYQAKTNEDVVPSVFGYKPFIVLSGSMETEIHVGDLILTKEVNPENLKLEDVIAFRDAEGTVTTHRIIDIVEKENVTYFVTKGDNNESQDKNLVEFKDVEGLYIGRIPGVGSLLNSLSQPTTIIIVILGVTVIFGIAFMITSKKERLEEEKEFLEFKKMKEEEAKALEEEKAKKPVKKTTSKTTKKTVEKKSSTSKKK